MKQMFSKHKKAILLSVGITLLPIVIGCILWKQLPASMALHWGTTGTADGFGSKASAVFILPAIFTLLDLLCLFITFADPKQKTQNQKALRMVFWIMPLLSLLSCCIVYAIALGRTIDITLFIPLLLGVLLLIMGNYMPKVKQNYTLGIKIHWTLRNEENWNKTHRFAGKLWVGSGIVMILLVLLPLQWAIFALVADIFVIAFVPVLYSYGIYKKHNAQGITYTAATKSKGQKRAAILTVMLVIAILVGVAVLMFTGNITYICGEDSLQIKASYYNDLEIAYTDMETIELRQDFEAGFRSMGFGSSRLSMGTFQNEEFSYYTLYAYNACDSVILICNGDNRLAINAATDEETQSLYEALLENWSADTQK